MSKRPEPILLLNDARGIYIPRDFIEAVKAECLCGVSDEDKAILLAGPDHEFYWETWDDVVQGAIVTAPAGRQIPETRYSVHCDGDVWLIPDGMEWSDEEDWFVWPETSDD